VHCKGFNLIYMYLLTHAEKCWHLVSAHAAFPRHICHSVHQFLIYSTFVLVLSFLASDESGDFRIIFTVDIVQSDYSHAPVSPLVPMLEKFSQPQRKSSTAVYLLYCLFSIYLFNRYCHRYSLNIINYRDHNFPRHIYPNSVGLFAKFGCSPLSS